MESSTSDQREPIRFSLDGSSTDELIWCPPGAFEIGDLRGDDAPLKETPHQVTLTRGFWIASLPVTQRLWKAVMGRKFRCGDSTETDPLPVDGVTWDTAMTFCESLSRVLHERSLLAPEQRISLPTEAQWEYACRAGTRTSWYFGSDAGDLDDHAWYEGNSGGRPHPVRQKKANPWGLFDVYGNVMEWCLDGLYAYEARAEVDPRHTSAEDQLKMARGGHYDGDADECRSASRRGISRDNPFVEETGLRIVCID